LGDNPQNPVFTTGFLTRKRWAETSIEQTWSILRAQSGSERGSWEIVWGWLRIMAGCEQVRAERREMFTAHRIFIIAKSQPKARG
jgi:hypothetical protein